MTVFALKDKRGAKGYIINHLDSSFLVDPKGDFQSIRNAIGSNSLKAIFLTKVQTNSLPLIAAFGDVPVYISNTNGTYVNKIAGVMNLSMIRFIFVKDVIGINLPELNVRLIPVVEEEVSGRLLVAINNMFFMGDLIFDERLVKKAYRLGPSNYYHKLVKLLFSNPNNIIYPEEGSAYPVRNTLKDNLKLRVYFQSSM